jgi:leader peptidase (prepilin peptidase)/N-methyltransferase
VQLFAAFCFFVIGASVGSFVNVATFRFGFSERASGRSRCMACEREIPWYDLFPIASFAALRARCRACGSALSLQYPLVEAAVGTLFALAYLLLPPALSFWPLVAFTALLVFLASLAGIVAYDIRHTLVPMPFAYVLIASAAFAAASQSLSVGSFAPLLDGLAGAATLFLFFILIFFATRGRGMGAGDAYVAAAIGILLGFSRGAEAVMLGIWSGTLVALFFLLLSSLPLRMRLFGRTLHVTMKTEVPLAPFLALGAGLALFTALSPLAWAASISGLFFSGRL